MQENSPFNPVAPSPSSTHAAADSATPAFWPNASSAAPLAAAPPSYAPVASAANESGASSWGNAMDQTAASQNPALGTAASPAASPAASGNIVSLVATRDSGARWFLWIAGLSLVNALLMTFGSDHTFGLGLGSTLLVDAVAKDVATKTPQLLAGARLTELLFDGVIIGLFALFGFKALRGKKWAFLVGGVLLALDTLLVLAFRMWFGVLIHAWAVFSIFTAMGANSKVQALEKAGSQPDSAWS